MPPQVQNHGLFLPILLSTNQSQARQQLLSQNMQNCMASNGVQSFAGLQATLPLVSGVTQTIPNTVVQDPNMQSIPGVSQNSVGNSMGQGNPSTMFANSQRQMPASLDSTAQTGHAKGADWQEEIYQKIKVMKETYFLEINEIYQRIAAKLQQELYREQGIRQEELGYHEQTVFHEVMRSVKYGLFVLICLFCGM
uniref:Uncharacterized protein n=1 Tax=Populus trichocarpa TaxID=3694 RepID=A0A3N7FAP3_POPTR|eukprot:XP_024448052.1 mediator of RNA polymerase II transcription subunit 15a isoform X1 [Populus trichocarpa]